MKVGAKRMEEGKEMLERIRVKEILVGCIAWPG